MPNEAVNSQEGSERSPLSLSLPPSIREGRLSLDRVANGLIASVVSARVQTTSSTGPSLSLSLARSLSLSLSLCLSVSVSLSLCLCLSVSLPLPLCLCLCETEMESPQRVSLPLFPRVFLCVTTDPSHMRRISPTGGLAN